MVCAPVARASSPRCDIARAASSSGAREANTLASCIRGLLVEPARCIPGSARLMSLAGWRFQDE
eukprot:15435786-Alexandrium_andersonii.AAC.1